MVRQNNVLKFCELGHKMCAMLDTPSVIFFPKSIVKLSSI